MGLSIVRSKSQRDLADPTISFRAKGILHLLMTTHERCPNQKYLIGQSNDGSRAVRSGLNELIGKGMIERDGGRYWIIDG